MSNSEFPVRVTHQQIADKLGVSRTLVTGVLHGTGRFGVNEGTRQTIERTAREMGYRPRNVTTHTIGCVMHPELMHSTLEVSFIIAIEGALRERGYRLMLINPDVPEGQALADIINTKMLDGLLLTSWDDGRFAHLLSPKMPCVLLSEEDDASISVEQVGCDVEGSADIALAYLAGYGHERIAVFLGGRKKLFFDRFARAVERSAAKLNGANPLRTAPMRLHVEESLPQHSGRRLIELLKSPEPPTAVLTTDVEHATSVCCNLLGAGYSIPHDVSVMSLFDGRLMEFLAPRVTATTVGGNELAVRGVLRLMELIEMPETIRGRRFITGELIERESVGPALGVR